MRENRMLISGEMRYDEPISRTYPERVIPFHALLVGLVAGSLLLIPVLTLAAVPSAQPGHAPGKIVVSAAPQSASNGLPRVSPYAIVNKQRAAAGKSQLPAMQLPVRRVNR